MEVIYQQHKYTYYLIKHQGLKSKQERCGFETERERLGQSRAGGIKDERAGKRVELTSPSYDMRYIYDAL